MNHVIHYKQSHLLLKKKQMKIELDAKGSQKWQKKNGKKKMAENRLDAYSVSQKMAPNNCPILLS